MFKIRKKSKKTAARSGVLTVAGGKIKTPFFMPDATRGFIKTAGHDDLVKLDMGPMVVNTYHLFLQPKTKVIKRAGGIHKFMNWPGPLLSDSGGFQVFSLVRQARRKSPLGKVTDRGVIFKSPLDGKMHELTPEKAIKIQFDLGVDMMVALDDCPPNDAPKDEIARSVARTIAWARRCWLEFWKQIKKRKIEEKKRPLLFCVIQGGADLKLRKYCVEKLMEIGFSAQGGPASGWDGYGFGARPVDKKGRFLGEVLKYTAGLIPENSLRFALGIGLPKDIVRCVAYGWDMFDCVIPTREGRHGRLFFWRKKSQFSKNTKNFYKTINITNAKFARDFSPINPDSKLPELKRHSKAYLHHLFKLKEPLGQRLASLNNLEFYLDLMESLRRKI